MTHLGDHRLPRYWRCGRAYSGETTEDDDCGCSALHAVRTNIVSSRGMAIRPSKYGYRYHSTRNDGINRMAISTRATCEPIKLWRCGCWAWARGPTTLARYPETGTCGHLPVLPTNTRPPPWMGLDESRCVSADFPPRTLVELHCKSSFSFIQSDLCDLITGLQHLCPGLQRYTATGH